ncbi:cyclic nucleotide-binding domain-containing protein [Synechococcus sp. PCC 7336]|uniref:cyclic nucleotide-binding domain-containing protein n=1 Tax=Synechococcus sp. PCC 7336 TaxID=195250 RepID=UPI000349D2A7|nr:cyclic nucleotide-binding domain-containing protein [Synechococcus sp. PCC 7336]
MYGKVSERVAHRVRWILVVLWLLLIVSLLYDPISAWFTLPEQTFSLFRVNPDHCIAVQGKCLNLSSYQLGAPIFWGAIVPIAIFILLVFGHELWRRICPLSFLSQLPRALNSQRRIKRTDKKGNVRYELAKVDKNSWLARNYLYLQLGLFFIGLSCRILFVNADRTALSIWLLTTIVAAVGVGWYYGGKSWCNYFCPMSPVQRIYSEPGGLFTSPAHTSPTNITQSMCRTITPEGKEESACVACQTPCIDIDSERSYWENITKPDRKVLYYGYLGLMVGYFGYYYLYAGNWEYYMSGVWAADPAQLSQLLNPGFYLFGTPIPIPKLVAVPLTIGGSAILFIALGRWFEGFYQSIRERLRPVDAETRQHEIFSLVTFFCFNFFFIFGGRQIINAMPPAALYLYEGGIVILSTAWLIKTWLRNPNTYSREKLANRFRKQLVKLKLDVKQFLDGRTLEDLSSSEVYVLAKVLPGFTQEKRIFAYQGVLRDMIAEGHLDSPRSQAMLAQMRRELDISDRDHSEALATIGVSEDSLQATAAPAASRQEDVMRAIGFRQAFARLQRSQRPRSTNKTGNEHEAYALTATDRKRLSESHSTDSSLATTQILLEQLEVLAQRYRILNQPLLQEQFGAVTLLKGSLEVKERRIVAAILDSLADAAELTDSIESIVQSLADLTPVLLQSILAKRRPMLQRKLDPDVLERVETLAAAAPVNDLHPLTSMEPGAIAESLAKFAYDLDPLTQAVSLYLLSDIDLILTQAVSHRLEKRGEKLNRLVAEMIETILEQEAMNACPLNACPMTFRTVEKLICLSNSDFFGGMKSETAIELSYQASVLTHSAGEDIVGEGEASRELILLMEGDAQVTTHSPDGQTTTRRLVPGETIDELEILADPNRPGKIEAIANNTRILAVPVATFDELMDCDTEFSKRVLEMESRRLQQLLHTSLTVQGLPNSVQ